MDKNLKTKMLVAGVSLVLMSGGYYLYRHKVQSTKRNGEPQKSMEEILKERDSQAGSHLTAPLGQIFLSKDWNKFSSTYQPKTQYFELGEIIRACYIQNKFATFSPSDYEYVLKITFNTLLGLDVKDRSKAIMLLTQFFRLPLSKAGTPLYEELEKTALSSDAKDFARRISLYKIVQQDLQPPAELIKMYANGLSGNTLDQSRANWIQSMQYVKSFTVRKSLAKAAMAAYPKMDKSEQSLALSFIARSPDPDYGTLKKLAFKSLSESSPASVESGVRTTSLLLTRNQLSPKEKAEFLEKIAKLPPNLKSPFVEAKIHEMQKN